MASTRRNSGWVVLMAVLVIAALSWLQWGRDPGTASTEPALTEPDTGTTETDTGAVLDVARVKRRTVPADAKPLKMVPCELSTLLDEYRAGKASPAYRRYVREQLRGLVESLPEAPLWSRLKSERDPDLLGLVAEAWVLRYALDGEPAVLERLVEHLGQEQDPVLRATLVRSLAHTGEPSTQLLGIKVLKGRDVYRDWVKDPAPQVRAAVVENFREEAARNFGRYRDVAERAISLASVAEDPTTAAGLLTSTSIEAVRSPAVAQVRGLLQSSEHARVRASAARALATSPVSELSASLEALAARYTLETDPGVRTALLESLSRLGLSRAVPVLRRLRDVDPATRAEVDGWLALLAERPQTRELLDKARRARDARTAQH
ncbi:HEAT repeat domain-containing protein [Pyxidicoccus xibeiensis]|uniref:HEAT repeat domain-containing protein n=1 Tax=Pyxidicoccus xibeiensis TaxID=2906759 RepID=UPI0020A7EDAA|nr:HEAT repeat domain-containing protein [Pyxidicoccus xibeiensis]MCP3136504.1 HEAT repeat domain-containing protein [Pyxidicoccus xibeiensis]